MSVSGSQKAKVNEASARRQERRVAERERAAAAAALAAPSAGGALSGDLSAAGGGGGGRAPTKRMRDGAIRAFGRACVIDIDEFDTSKTCHVCGDVLQGVVDKSKNHKSGRPTGALERSLKRCARTSCSSFFDRDVNVRQPTPATATLCPRHLPNHPPPHTADCPFRPH